MQADQQSDRQRGGGRCGTHTHKYAHVYTQSSGLQGDFSLVNNYYEMASRGALASPYSA